MIEPSPFRILILDDKIYETVRDSDDWKTKHASLESQQCQFVNEFLDANEPVEIILAANVTGDKLFKLTQKGKKEAQLETEVGAWLSQFHVLVLDMDGIGEIDNVKGLENAILQHLAAIGETVEPASLTKLLQGKAVQGVKFYHHYLEHLKSVRAVLILTYYEDRVEEGKEIKTPASIRQLLEPFCKDENHLPASIPWTIKHGKTTGTGERIARVIHDLHKDFTEGYEMLTNRGQIEFAATTDHPVLIIGESGTGKEYVASAIRRAWEREKNIVAKQERGYAVLNCGCITDADAHAHFFGAVRGSATSAMSHHPGIILQACGCHVLGYDKPDASYQAKLKKALLHATDAAEKVTKLGCENDQGEAMRLVKLYLQDLRQVVFPTETSNGGPATMKDSLPQVLEDMKTHLQNLMDGTDAAAKFKQKLMEHFKDRLIENPNSPNPFDLHFKEDAGILGTLFLDEFGDMPPLAQSLLLRFLESGTQEIQPQGYPGRITGVRLRVIAATSDKEVADMAGVKDLMKRAGDRPRPHPIRYDLVQRLRWHTIRVEPVNEHNVEATINAMISRAGDLKWDEGDKGAIGALKAHALKQAATEHFNHRRELWRIVEMTTQHVSKGRQRGLREFAGGKVTKEIVGRFLTTPPPTAPHNPGERPSAHELPREADKKLRTEETKLRGEIEAILPDLDEGWKHLELRNAINAKTGSADQIKALLATAIGLGVADVGYCGRPPAKPGNKPGDKTPRYGIAYAISMGKTNWEAVKKQLTAANVKFDPPGKKQETLPPAKAKRGGKK